MTVFVVPRVRVELTSSCEGQLLRLVRLPVSPPRRDCSLTEIDETFNAAVLSEAD